MSDVEQTRSIIERWIGAAAVAVLALACLLILRPFISAALWAAILCFTTWPLFIRLKARLGGRPTIAASLATLALLEVMNGGGERLWLDRVQVDPDYYMPLEAAQPAHFSRGTRLAAFGLL